MTTETIPIFPLKTVLFPGMLLPLHIFEPRYQLMINRCLESHSPFGVVLIRHGKEVGGPAEPYRIGTTAHITQVERIGQGRMNIQVVGYQRFRIVELQHDNPYLTATTKMYPLPAPNEHQSEIDRILPEIQKNLRTYMDALEKTTDTQFDLQNIPHDGMAVAFLSAIMMPLPLPEKQHLLAADSLLAMLQIEARLLRREIMLLDILRNAPPSLTSTTMPFSRN